MTGGRGAAGVGHAARAGYTGAWFGSGFRVWVLGFGVWGLGFGV